jgi:5,10-methylene-tetrahydrofolate dehydrogenase/methenyl tetrahydrofolate cyclohydrolase
MKLINGNEVSQSIRLQIKDEVSKLKLEGKKVPHLAAIFSW